ncbi:MAG: PEP-CTERM sorting domain-containing protein [Opitutaceae bacterium]|jgi:hypothetical protein|nr:PEP-CTERM sorting domain-containing protein [Opitutaceae bacterium]
MNLAKSFVTNIQRAALAAALLAATAATIQKTCAAAPDVTVSFSATAPSENIVASITADIPSNNYAWHKSASDQFRDIMQTFSVDTNVTLDKFTFLIWADWYSGNRAALENAEFNVSLVTIPAQGASVTPTQTIATWTGRMPTPLPENSSSEWYNGKYITFEVPDTSLSAGTLYGLVFSFVNPAANQGMNLAIRYGATPGVYYKDSTHTDWTNSNNGLIFYALSARGTSIPEPSTSALLTGAVILASLVFLRRHRR